jgi:hypothetical protein
VEHGFAIVSTAQGLSADGLFALIRNQFETANDPRSGLPTIPLGAALMAAFAMFSLKCASLLAFDKCRNDPDIQRLYRVGRIPGDTSMREILDGVDPAEIRPAFTDVFRDLQRGKVLEQFVDWDDCYLLSLDGTQYFASNKVHCSSCQEKHSHTGVTTCSHAAVGVVLVYPDNREVIPLCPEPIIRQDGKSKNDCERNATRRLLDHVRREHPHLGFIVIEDGLSSNGPHFKDLLVHRMHFILDASKRSANRVLSMTLKWTGFVSRFNGGRIDVWAESACGERGLLAFASEASVFVR